jgi:predicted ATP-grasp superfamily ATP-dependent carboligase
VEADPSLIENALKELTVLNAPASAVATCRSVAFLEEMAVDTLRFPKVGFDKNHDDCKYLIKEFSSAGGVGVRDDDGKNLRGGRYRQRVINGFSIGASFLTVSKDGVYATRLMGLAGHIGRVEEFGQRDYLYGGLAYPASVDSTISETIRRFGERAAAASSLVGWWGADFIVNENAYLLEINPRFTASMELIADAHGIDLVGTQISAINGVMFNGGAAQAEGCRATAVCYAKDDFIFNGAREWFDLGARDIPHDGNIIKKGEPIISLYARAGSCDKCMRILKEQAAKLYIKG